MPPPAHGTIFDLLSDHNISWCNYFSDMPMTAVIPSIILKHFRHHASVDKFFRDCEAGTLPAVSFVDPRIGLMSEIGAPFKSLPPIVKDALEVLGVDFDSKQAPAETQEDPQDMYWGEAWAAKVVQAVIDSKNWERTLLIYIYDEHGGYYDHLPPPAAIAPDTILPNRQEGDAPGVIQPLRATGPGSRRLPVLSPRRRDQRDSRPHLGSRDDRGQMEPTGAHQPRCERAHRHGLPRPRSQAPNRDQSRRAAHPRSVRSGRSCRGSNLGVTSPGGESLDPTARE